MTSLRMGYQLHQLGFSVADTEKIIEGQSVAGATFPPPDLATDGWDTTAALEGGWAHPLQADTYGSGTLFHVDEFGFTIMDRAGLYALSPYVRVVSDVAVNVGEVSLSITGHGNVIRNWLPGDITAGNPFTIVNSAPADNLYRYLHVGDSVQVSVKAGHAAAPQGAWTPVTLTSTEVELDFFPLLLA